MGMAAHFGHVTINIWYKFTPLNLRIVYMKFELNWPSGFWENYVLIYWWVSNMRGQKSTLTFETYL